MQVEAAFEEGQNGKEKALESYNQKQIDQLNDLIRYVALCSCLEMSIIAYLNNVISRSWESPVKGLRAWACPS